MGAELAPQERYYRLDGLVFRVRLDRLDLGAEYLRHDRWVWTPITSGSVMHNPHALELASADAARYAAIV
jgi:hypothetical protein